MTSAGSTSPMDEGKPVQNTTDNAAPRPARKAARKGAAKPAPKTPAPPAPTADFPAAPVTPTPAAPAEIVKEPSLDPADQDATATGRHRADDLAATADTGPGTAHQTESEAEQPAESNAEQQTGSDAEQPAGSDAEQPAKSDAEDAVPTQTGSGGTQGGIVEEPASAPAPATGAVRGAADDMTAELGGLMPSALRAPQSSRAPLILGVLAVLLLLRRRRRRARRRLAA